LYGYGFYEFTELASFVEAITDHSDRWEVMDLILPFDALRSIGSDFPSSVR
jgi:hypothetical protein